MDDIKFFQNELTNIEAKLVAMQLSFDGKKEDERLAVINSLVKTERNPVAGKDSCDPDGLDHKSLVDLVKVIGDIINKKAKD